MWGIQYCYIVKYVYWRSRLDDVYHHWGWATEQVLCNIPGPVETLHLEINTGYLTLDQSRPVFTLLTWKPFFIYPSLSKPILKHWILSATKLSNFAASTFRYRCTVQMLLKTCQNISCLDLYQRESCWTMIVHPCFKHFDTSQIYLTHFLASPS